MKENYSKSGLAIALSKLKSFENPKIRLEQYSTPSELAASILWIAHMKGDLQGKTADFGCGTGILGLGALLLGCPEVLFVESEEKTLQTCKENYKELKKKYPTLGKVSFFLGDVTQVNTKMRTVLQNPPFGTKEKHIDQVFLEKALSCADVVYTIHKVSTKTFIDRFIDEKGCRVTDYFEHAFPIKASMKFHKKPKKNVLVGVWRAEKKAL